MIVRVNAKRWDEPIEIEEPEVVIRDHPDRPGWVILTSPNGGTAAFELGADFGETIEIRYRSPHSPRAGENT